jgi:hypothetical protein
MPFKLQAIPKRPPTIVPATANSPTAVSPAATSPTRARIVLALVVAGIAGCVAVSLSPIAKGRAEEVGRGANDMSLYRDEVVRVANGEAYYDAVNAELRAQGYPTRSVFNWRTPLLVWILASLPSPRVGQAILGGLAIILALWAVAATVRERNLVAGVMCGVLMCGALLFVTGDAYYLPVMWAGVLMGLSLCAYESDRRALAVVFGLAALLFRELAAPYCIGALVLAAHDRRWRESIAWVIGFAGYAAFYAYHIAEVQARILPTDAAHDGTWWQAGGLPFLISLAQINAFLLVAPQALAAAYLALSVIGATAFNSTWGRRAALTTCGYLVTFALVGYEFNQYWGVLISPLLAMCAAHAPAAMAKLFRDAGLLRRDSLASAASVRMGG